ncbi:hypothetical protein [Nocardioides sp. NPDC006273]
MTDIETILESWISDRSADLADEACRMGIADYVERSLPGPSAG